jgi:hypothetical protein
LCFYIKSFAFFYRQTKNFSLFHWRLVKNILLWFFLRDIMLLNVKVCLLIICFIADDVLYPEQIRFVCALGYLPIM